MIIVNWLKYDVITYLCVRSAFHLLKLTIRHLFTVFAPSMGALQLKHREDTKKDFLAFLNYK